MKKAVVTGVDAIADHVTLMVVVVIFVHGTMSANGAAGGASCSVSVNCGDEARARHTYCSKSRI